MSGDDLIEIGFIREAHALRGQVVVHAFSGQEESLTQYGPLRNQDGSRFFEFTIVNAKGNDFLCSVKGVTDRTTAEKLRGTKLFIPASALPDTAEDEFYIRDLIGLNVIDRTGMALGKVLNVYNLGHHDAFEIEFVHGRTAPLDKPQIEMLLYTKDNIINVDIATKIMTIDLPVGLLETPDKQ